MTGWWGFEGDGGELLHSGFSLSGIETRCCMWMLFEFTLDVLCAVIIFFQKACNNKYIYNLNNL